MESEILRRRSVATIKNLGVNTYSQIVSAFRAQGDLTEEKLNLLPVLQNALGISRERHTAEIKRALNDEQLTEIATSLQPTSTTVNWESQANYACPTIVHRPPMSDSIQFAEQILRTTPATTIIQHPSTISTIKLNPDLKQLIRDEVKHDGIQNATNALPQQPTTAAIAAAATHAMKTTLNNPEISGSNVIRLVRAKPTTKRKSSLDTLIEVVQKELLRVNEENPSLTSLPSFSPKSSHRSNQLSTSRSIIPTILPSSHPGSLTSQSNHSLKITRKHPLNNFKRSASYRSRQTSFNHDDHVEPMEHDQNETNDQKTSESESIEDIVRETVDKLVALTLLNTAPFIFNMLTAVPGANSSSSETKVSNTTTNNISTMKVHTVPSKHIEPRTSPMKSQQQLHHPQLIIQPTSTNSTTSATGATPLSTIPGSTTPALFVAPRIINFQTVVPKPTTNIQIGNTKIILVSPSNIGQHLPHSASNSSTVVPTGTVTSSHSSMLNNSPVKLVKFTTTTPTNSLNTRSTPLPLNSTGASTLTLPKNVQIVIPSATQSSIQLARTHNDEMKPTLSNSPSTSATPTTTFRPINTMPMTLTTCSVNQIPQATQEVTISTSPNSSPPLNPNNLAELPNSTIAPIDRISPSHDEMIKSVSMTPPVRPASTHGPMIYRMTSVNPNVPVFRVRTATAPTATNPLINKTIKTEAKPITMATTTSMCYDPKPTHPTATTSGSVSVLACFKTTKKRNKERAIMPRPSTTTETTETSIPHELPQRMNSTPNSSFVHSNDHLNSNGSLVSSPDCPSRLLHPQLSLPDEISSSSSIPILRHNSTQFDDLSISTRNLSSPTTIRCPSPVTSPMPTFQSISLLKSTTEDKSIQCLEQNSNEIERDDSSLTTTTTANKRKQIDDEDPSDSRWTHSATNFLQEILSHNDFHLLDEASRTNVSSKFQLIETNLLNDSITSIEEFIQTIEQMKSQLNADVLVENLFEFIHGELARRFPSDQSTQKRSRREID